MSVEQVARATLIDTYSYIIESEAENLIFEDACEILTRIMRKKKNRKWVNEAGNGTNIRLDKLSENMIITIFNFMKDKLQLDDPIF